jgi:hypothetical protein
MLAQPSSAHGAQEAPASSAFETYAFEEAASALPTDRLKGTETIAHATAAARKWIVVGCGIITSNAVIAPPVNTLQNNIQIQKAGFIMAMPLSR